MPVTITIKKKLPPYSLDLSLSFSAGELIAVLGPSGAGKSTLIRLIAGLDSPDEGTIQFGNTTWFSSRDKITTSPQQRKIGMVFQEYPLFPHLSVWNNIAFAAPDTSVIESLLSDFNIAHLAKQKPARISGGERQRVALCQALASQPELLLLDEPFSALDINNRQQIRRLLKRIVREQNIPVLHITHDLEEAFYLADRFFVMENGRESRTWLSRQLSAGRTTNSVYDYKSLSIQPLQQGKHLAV